jgi:hypothetical protein
MEPVDPVDENQNTPHVGRKPSEKSDDAKPNIPKGSPLAQLHPAEPQQGSTSTPEKDWWDKSKRWLEFAGVLFLATYTGCTIAMYFANKESADAAKSAADTAIHTMHLDARAWVNTFIGRGSLIDNRPLLMPIKITNDGKTAALNLTGRVVVNLLPAEDEPDLTYKTGHPSYSIDVKALAPQLPQVLNYAALPKYVPESAPLTPMRSRQPFERELRTAPFISSFTCGWNTTTFLAHTIG